MELVRKETPLYVPTNQTHTRCVLSPGPRMALSLSPNCSPVREDRPGFHAKLNTVQGSESNKRGGGGGQGLSLPREIKWSIILYTAFMLYPGLSHPPPKHLCKCSISLQLHCLDPHPDLFISLPLHSHCLLPGLPIFSITPLIHSCTKQSDTVCKLPYYFPAQNSFMVPKCPQSKD